MPRRRFAATPQPAFPGLAKCRKFPSPTPGWAVRPTPIGFIATMHARRRLPRPIEQTMFEAKPDPMIARDLVGYGARPLDPRWPGDALIAVNFNLNVEGGGESTLVNGDEESEGMLNDIGVATHR